jgi:uncharacterized protein (TIGR02246 family)
MRAMARRGGLDRSMRLVVSLVLAAAGAAAGCSPAERDPDQDRAGIDSARRLFAAAYSAGDLERSVDVYTPTAVLMPQYQPALMGRSAIRSYLKRAFEQLSIQLTLSSEEVVFVSDGFAYDSGRYSARTAGRSGGSVTEDVGKYLVLWRRQDDGSWKIERDIDNSSNPVHWNRR